MHFNIQLYAGFRYGISEFIAKLSFTHLIFYDALLK